MISVEGLNSKSSFLYVEAGFTDNPKVNATIIISDFTFSQSTVQVSNNIDMFGMIVFKLSSTIYVSLSHLKFSEIALTYSKGIDVIICY